MKIGENFRRFWKKFGKIMGKTSLTSYVFEEGFWVRNFEWMLRDLVFYLTLIPPSPPKSPKLLWNLITISSKSPGVFCTIFSKFSLFCEIIPKFLHKCSNVSVKLEQCVSLNLQHCFAAVLPEIHEMIAVVFLQFYFWVSLYLFKKLQMFGAP